MNRRMRKRIEKEGVILHLYAGPNEGFTLKEAMKSMGGDTRTLLEVDILRGKGHNMLDQRPYDAFLRLALDGKVRALLTGPNCRTRSVLRHYPVSPSEHGPRPLRAWGGEEFGRRDLTKEERAKVQEDDILLWRSVMIYVVGEVMGRAQGGGKPPIVFGLEQPTASPYVKENVSIWDTKQWKALRNAHNLKEVEFDQGDWRGEDGHGCRKPTTIGGNLDVEAPWMRNPEIIGRKEGRMKDSKTLSRWVPGLMKEISREIMQKCQGKDVSLKAMTWQEHLRHGHVPFRRDCRICQEAGAKAAPHRRLAPERGQFPRAGVLSIDTSGPLVPGEDVTEEKMKFLLIGAYTWLAPKKSPMDDAREEDSEQQKVGEGQEEVTLEAEEKGGDQEAETPIEGQEDGGAEEGKKKEEVEGSEKDEDIEEKVRQFVEDAAELEVKTFRMVTPLPSKSGDAVLQATIDMILKLRLDGFEVFQVHSDNGGEFTSASMKRWMRARGYVRTYTGNSDPQANGRAENAVQQVKNQIRRLLLQANYSTDQWPIAARHADEQLRRKRLGLSQNFPPLGKMVLTKKRAWRSKEFAPTMEKVEYLCPSWESHGHWIRREDGTKIVTRFYISRVVDPPDPQAWIGLMEEYPDPLDVRRRIRGKQPPFVRLRMVQGEDQKNEEEKEDEREEDELEEASRIRQRALQIIMTEMTALMEDPDEEMIKHTMKSVTKLRSVMEVTGESEEVLQTKIIGAAEVMRDWKEWERPIKEELIALVEDKEALRVVSKEEAAAMFREAHEQGRKLEVVPGKLVTTIKPGPDGGKRKARLVACGNFTERDAQDELYAGTGDAVTLRILVKKAAEKNWEGVIVDVKAAFLNTPWTDLGVLVKPPHMLIRMGMVEEGTLYLPTKALYGFRKSPRLWGNHRDLTLRSMDIWIHDQKCRLVPLLSEPNLWRLIRAHEEDELEAGKEVEALAMMMVYVDDIFAVGPPEVLKKVVEVVRNEWKTSEPEWTGASPVRFLGINIRREWCDEEQKVKWRMTQEDYTKEMLKRNLGEDEEKWPKRKIPLLKERPEEAQDRPQMTQVRRAQKIAGELLWLSTRTRPDLMFAVSKVAAQVLHHPEWVEEAAKQIWGYLAATREEGLTYESGDPMEEWEEEAGIQTYADASFSPGGAESHGSVVVMLRGSVLLWKSSKQSTVTLSTAEAELNELIEGLMVGESVAAIVEELEPMAMKIMASDSQAAINICMAEGGSWRTRHLRLRAAHAKQRFTRGDWVLKHKPGREMLADIGTKILPAARFEALKTGLGMQKMRKEEKGGYEREDGKRDRDPEAEKDQKTGGKKDPKVPQELVKALQAITIMATLKCGKAMEGNERPPDSGYLLQILLFAYSTFLVLLTLILRWMWDQWWVQNQQPSSRKDEKKGKKEGRSKKRKGSDEEEEEEEEEDEGGFVWFPFPPEAPFPPDMPEIPEIPDLPETLEPPPRQRRSEPSSSAAAPAQRRRVGGGGGPNPENEGRRRTPVVYITPTGTRYHVARDCVGLRNAHQVHLATWCRACRNMEILDGRELYNHGVGFPLHKRFYLECARGESQDPEDHRPQTRELTPCRVCVPAYWPEEDRRRA